MRLFIEILVCGLALTASAFDSDAWLAKRELLNQEVDRLRSTYTNLVTRVVSPATDVTVPFDTFEDGSVKTVIQAEQAQYFVDGGFVWAHGVTVRKFKRDGSLDLRIDAQDCLIDRHTKSGWVEGPARLTMDKTVMDGENIYFSSPEGYVRTTRNARIVSEDLKTGGLRP